MSKEKKNITISKEAWNTLRRLQVKYDKETYSKTLTEVEERLKEQEAKIKALMEEIQEKTEED